MLVQHQTCKTFSDLDAGNTPKLRSCSKTLDPELCGRGLDIFKRCPALARHMGLSAFEFKVNCNGRLSSLSGSPSRSSLSGKIISVITH